MLAQLAQLAGGASNTRLPTTYEEISISSARQPKLKNVPIPPGARRRRRGRLQRVLHRPEATGVPAGAVVPPAAHRTGPHVLRRPGRVLRQPQEEASCI